MKLRIILSLLLIGLLFPGCATNRINSFDGNRENNIYRVDDVFFPTAGKTADMGVHIIVYIFFSYKIILEPIFKMGERYFAGVTFESILGSRYEPIDVWEESYFVGITNDLLSKSLMQYLDLNFFPMHTLKNIIEIIVDGQYSLVLDGFSEYIKDNEDLKHVRVTDIRMELDPILSEYLENQKK